MAGSEYSAPDLMAPQLLILPTAQCNTGNRKQVDRKQLRTYIAGHRRDAVETVGIDSDVSVRQLRGSSGAAVINVTRYGFTCEMRIPCVTSRSQIKPSNTQEPKQRLAQQRTTARSSANLLKPTQTPPRYTIVQDIRVLQIPEVQAASSKSTHTCRAYTGMRPHAPGHQESGHPVPTRTGRHNPPRVWMHRHCVRSKNKVSG